MKHCGAATILYAMLACSAIDATGAREDWQLGLKGGVNRSQMRGTDVASVLSVPQKDFRISGSVGDWMTGGVIGGFVRRDFGEMTSVQFEILYSQKGGTGPIFGDILVEAPGNVFYPAEITGDLTLSLDYLEMPLMVVWTFPTDDRLALTAQAGGYFGLLLGSEVRIKGDASATLPDGSTRKLKFDQTSDAENVREWDAGGVIGLGMVYSRGLVNWNFDARWSFGLASIDMTSQQRDIRNSALSLLVGIAWPLRAN